MRQSKRLILRGFTTYVGLSTVLHASLGHFTGPPWRSGTAGTPAIWSRMSVGQTGLPLCEAIRRQMAERSEVAKLLQLGHITAFFSDDHSLGIGSCTTVNGKVVSIGAFGGVFVREQAVLVDAS